MVPVIGMVIIADTVGYAGPMIGVALFAAPLGVKKPKNDEVVIVR